MKSLLILGLLFISSCATKHVVPGNRFLTPETQGDGFRGQFEIQQTSGNELSIDVTNDSVKDGVVYSDLSRTGFLYSNSLFNQFDLYWSHMGTGNSMLGGKYQFLGDSRVAATEGHKMSVAAAFGGNEHETDDRSVEFELTGTELMLLYGYRFTPNFLTYSSYSFANYNFSGRIRSSNPALNRARPDIDTIIHSLSGGLELSWEMLFFKLEGTYQQLSSSQTKDKDRFILGYSVGLAW